MLREMSFLEYLFGVSVGHEMLVASKPTSVHRNRKRRGQLKSHDVSLSHAQLAIDEAI